MGSVKCRASFRSPRTGSAPFNERTHRRDTWDGPPPSIGERSSPSGGRSSAHYPPPAQVLHGAKPTQPSDPSPAPSSELPFIPPPTPPASRPRVRHPPKSPAQ